MTPSFQTTEMRPQACLSEPSEKRRTCQCTVHCFPPLASETLHRTDGRDFFHVGYALLHILWTVAMALSLHRTFCLSVMHPARSHGCVSLSFATHSAESNFIRLRTAMKLQRRILFGCSVNYDQLFIHARWRLVNGPGPGEEEMGGIAI